VGRGGKVDRKEGGRKGKEGSKERGVRIGGRLPRGAQGNGRPCFSAPFNLLFIYFEGYPKHYGLVSDSSGCDSDS